MTYLALGDSISIDDYTGVPDGGAAKQLAKLLNADELIDFTRDGKTSGGVLEELEAAAKMGDSAIVDVATLTVGGNDLLSGYYFREIGQRDADRIAFDTLARNLKIIAALLARLKCPVVLNTIYDPTDGDDSKAAEIGVPTEARFALKAANDLIRDCAAAKGFLLCDLEELFRGHGHWAPEPWIVMHIEPNFAGATQIAQAWHKLLAPSISTS